MFAVDLLLQCRVFGRIAAIERGADHRDGSALRVHGCSVCGSVDAVGETADDHDALDGELRCELASAAHPFDARLAGANDGDSERGVEERCVAGGE